MIENYNLLLNIMEKLHPSVDDLSDYCLENIFTYLPFDELYDSLSFVCNRWKKIIESMAKVIVFNKTESSKIINAILSYPETIQAISLLNIDEDISLILRYLGSFQKHLKYLEINCAKINGNSKIFARLLKQVLKKCQMLEMITLRSIEYHPADLILAFPEMENLRSLTIGDNPLLRPVDLLTIVLNCHHLNSIHLYEIDNLLDQDMVFMLSNRLTSKLQQFTLDHVNGLSADAYEAILKCNNLKMLNINGTEHLTPEILIKIPANLPRLESLKLEKVCGVSSTDYQNLFNEKMTLKQFVFTDCCTKFNDETLKALVLCLRHTLISLKLHNCYQLSTAAAINDCKLLQVLDLAGCKIIPDEEVQTLKLKNLQTLIMPSIET